MVSPSVEDLLAVAPILKAAQQHADTKWRISGTTCVDLPVRPNADRRALQRLAGWRHISDDGCRGTFRAVSTRLSGGRAYARHRGLSGPDADDLVAATYEVAWRRIDAVPGGEQTLPWLLTVALNQFRNHRRKLNRERTLLDACRRPRAQRHRRNRPPSAGGTFVRRLPPYRQTTGSSAAGRVGWAESGTGRRRAGIKPVAARSRLHRARARLAERLELDQEPPKPASVAHEPGENTPLRRS